MFAPLELGGVTLPNRVVVSPMCQYSAHDGSMTDWHLVHLGTFACSGAGLFVVEKTNVTREGRITHGCTGLYSDDNEATMARAVQVYRGITKNPVGVQIGHAGRKASSQPPFKGGKALGPNESPWPTVGPSPIPFGEGWHMPHELSRPEIQGLVDAFVAATERAKRIGFDVVELHSAHGYLLHQFLSPLANQRKDEYGRDRMKFALEVAKAVREVWPKEKALGARINATDWVEGGWGPENAVEYAKALEHAGLDFICVSSGATVPYAKIPVAPGYQVNFASQIKQNIRIPVRAVGMIADPEQAEAVVASGKADMVAMARAFLDNPRWVWHAAERFGVTLDYPPQYARSRHDLWPGAKLARSAK
ncbi:MAG TPA: NADH:flavin oxidoreductase/NADH oxidase [Burkholderiales bacterium]|nr:NADH:flavin oxidoreductase/NADH oxidase [Burkholderiales bacterium]